MNRPPTNAIKLPAGLARLLDQIRRRHLALSLARFPIYLFPTIAIAWVLQALADWTFDLSWGARCTFIILDSLLVLALFAWFFIRPIIQRFDRKSAALFAERGIPEFRSSLISSFEFTAPGADSLPASRLLIEQLLRRTTAVAKNAEVIPRILPTARLQDFALRMIYPLIAIVALYFTLLPTSAVLLKRILLAHTPFPPSTTLTQITQDLRVDEGTDVTLAILASGSIPPNGKLVIARPDSAPESISVNPTRPGSSEFSQTIRNVREPFSYHFQINDATGPTHQLSVHYPPAIKDLKFTQIYPAYTGLPDTEMPSTALKLLEGSTLRITGAASVAISSAKLQITGEPSIRPVAFRISSLEKTTFTANITVPASGWKSLSIALLGLENDPSRNDLQYPLLIERDKPPAINLTSPEAETLSVLENTTVPVSFEVSDDFGLREIKLTYQIFRPRPDASLESDRPATIPFNPPGNDRTWKHSFDWNLARLIPRIPIGSSIIFWLEVTDNNPNSLATTTIRSPEKTILIVSEEQKRLELLQKMAEKASHIETLYQQQRAISGRTESAIK